MNENLKSYILIKDSIPLGFALNSCAHAGVKMMLTWHNDPAVMEWTHPDNKMRKVTCRVTEQQFQLAKQQGIEFLVITESALDCAEVILAFKPRVDWPKFFKYLTLYR